MGIWKLNGKIYSCQISESCEIRGLCVAAYKNWEFRLISSGSIVSTLTFVDSSELHIGEALLQAYVWGTQLATPLMTRSSSYWMHTKHSSCAVWLSVVRQTWGSEFEDSWTVNIYRGGGAGRHEVLLHTVTKKFDSEEAASRFAFDFYLEKMVEHVA